MKRSNIIRIFIEIFIVLLAIYFFQNINIDLIISFVLIAIAIELFLNIKIEKSSSQESKLCPCCKSVILNIDLYKFLFKNIFKNEDYFYCLHCNQLIANLKYYKKKIFIVSFFTLGIIEIFLIVLSYYFLAIGAIFLWSIIYAYGLTFVNFDCYCDKDDANENDPTNNEFKKEKNLNVLLGILWFLFLIFALVLKFFRV